LLGTRIITAAILAAAALVTVLYFPSWAMVLVFGILWTIGAWEWALFVLAPKGLAAAYAAACALLMLATGPLFDAAGAWGVMLGALSWWVVAFVGVMAYPWPIPRAYVLTAGLLTLVPSWFLLSYIHNSVADGPLLVFTLLCVIWAADVGAYTCGRTAGRVKLAPRVSPGKTWEGVAGGLCGALVVALVAALLRGEPALSWVAIGIAAALISVVGDLNVSMFKRFAGKKDSGRLLPGHGGVLDRIDSLTAAAPVFFLGLMALGLLG
jgi:phosphatidate cytidylyltransferase